ncbi:hypothetical protein C8Q76DRAFT_300820 [Earliella scabrosa]|nr:hypothetical protein C8Q76DRAFT_300820 [Earliella scabrosa]
MQLDLPLKLDHSKVAISLAQTLHALYHAIIKAWLLAWPLAFPGGMFIIKYCATDAGLITRVCVFFRRVHDYARECVRTRGGFRVGGLGLGLDPSRYARYPSQEEEDAYWRASERMRQSLRASDAGAVRDQLEDGLPLVRYYTPRLLPTYREDDDEDAEAKEVYVSPKAFCKWHRMVFPGPMHPTTKEAQEQIKYYSSRDRREILRISRLLSDEEVRNRRRTPWTPRYAKMWKDWLDTKGPDVAIVFE